MNPGVRRQAFLAIALATLLLLNTPLYGAWGDDDVALTTRATRHVSTPTGFTVETGDNVDFRPDLNARHHRALHPHKNDPDRVFGYDFTAYLSKPVLKLYELHHSYLI